MKLTGIILIVVGCIALAYQGFNFKHTEKDAQLGPITIQHTETDHVPLPPIVGAICIAGGIAALVLGIRNKA